MLKRSHHQYIQPHHISIGSSYKKSEYTTHGGSPPKKLIDCAELYLQHYQSRPEFIHLTSDQRRKYERELIIHADKQRNLGKIKVMPLSPQSRTKLQENL